MDLELEQHALDDADLASMMSPPRGAHRRVRSDPSDFMQSLRADRFPEGGEGESPSHSFKRELSADVTTGVSPTAKKHAADPPRSRPPSSSSDEPEDDTVSRG